MDKKKVCGERCGLGAERGQAVEDPVSHDKDVYFT